MVKSKLGFFQMQVKSAFIQSSEFAQPGFGKCPETFYPIYVRFSISKFVNSVFDSIMLLISQIHETIITTPGIRMNNTFYADFSSNYRLKRLAFTVWNYLGIDLTIPLENPKNNRFTPGSSSLNTFNPSGPEITPIDFHFSRKWRLLLTIIGNYLSDLNQIFVDCIAIHLSQLGNLRGCQIQRKMPDNLLKFVFRNVCSFFIPVNLLHNNNLTYLHLC